MTIPSLLHSVRLDNSLLLGFYGGGNYGDELLMEIMAGLLKKQGAKDVSIAFQNPETYATYHHDFGYPRVNIHHKKALVKAMLRKRHIVVGGGGLWGMDTNMNVLLMSIMLFVCRWVLDKKVYLLGVGYYASAPRLGRIAAWFAGTAARTIIARDAESYHNFRRLNKRTEQDVDIAWYIDQLDLLPYQTDVAALERQVSVTSKTLFITLRRFRGAAQQQLTATIAACLARNVDKPIIIALLEPAHLDPEGYQQLTVWRTQYPTVQIIDFAFNPLALFLFFQAHHRQIIFIGPQFHAILSAHLTGVPYLPLAYDNKVHNLLQTIAPKKTPIALNTLDPYVIQQFIDNAYAAPA